MSRNFAIQRQNHHAFSGVACDQTIEQTVNRDPTKCERYEKSVQNVITTVSTMLNPFDTERNSLVSLASGFVVDDNVADSFLEAEQSGENQFLDFVQNLISEEPDIFQPIKKKTNFQLS